MGINLPFAYNRKEAKDHGEGGSLVGAPEDKTNSPSRESRGNSPREWYHAVASKIA
jgi:hypothetical protein